MERSSGVPPHLFVFITGAAVMATEMSASRFIAPWFGTSMIVWSVLIAVVLAAMSLGYWYGGRLADRKPSWQVLHLLPVITGVFISLIPFMGRLLFSALAAGIRGTPVNVLVLSFLGIVAVFVPPVFVLAMVSPFVVKLLARADNTGRTAGSLYAMSTLGSIFGTLTPTLLTIPLLGTRETLFLCSAMLIILGGLGLRGKKRFAFALVALPLSGWLFSGSGIRDTENVVHEEESLYQYLQVQQRDDGTTLLIVNEGGAMQSIARLNDTLNPASTYYESYLLLPYMGSFQNGPDVLVIGAGGGTIPHWLAVYVEPHFPGMEIEAVEIDPRATELGYQYFGSSPEEFISHEADGRIFIESAEEKWDIIITDTYSNQIYIPFHLTTVEYFQALRDHLNPGGIIAMNVNAISESSRLLHSVGITVAEVFPYLYRVPVANDYNYMIIASDHQLQAPPPDSFPEWNPWLQYTAQLFQPSFESFQPDNGMILTDNRAPVEFMTDVMIAQGASGGSR